jgi:hypothetical protein
MLKAQLLMILHSIRSNRQLVEQIHYNFLLLIPRHETSEGQAYEA